MLKFILIALIILLLFILISGEYILKRKLKIESIDMRLFSKNRNGPLQILDLITIAIFLSVGATSHYMSSEFSPTYYTKLLITAFFVLEIIRGIELIIFNRDKKSYYHQILRVVVLIAIFIVFNYADNYLL